MSEYFSLFPKINYSNNNVIDITVRFDLLERVKKIAVLYRNYEVKDEERPDTVAHKFYKNASYDWIIYLVNQIHDPYFEWPLSNRELEDHIKKKYGSIENSYKIVKFYQWVKREGKRYTDGTVVDPLIYNVSKPQYDSLIYEKRNIVSAYEWEIEENERRRKIKILDKPLIPQIRREAEEIFV